MLVSAFPAAAQNASQHKPPLKLDRPGWLPLTGPQIMQTFADRMLILDEAFEPYPGVRVVTFGMGGCPPTETFSANGGWTRFECRRGPHTYQGSWTTEKFRGGERLCVQAPDFPRLCRFVWAGIAGDRIIMGANREHQDDPQTYNPYRLTRTR
ncbi:hypothetical protein P1X14_03665 [Sphingomonas sp. AOB5]|uniref:hypothetical protein n=1 Tax=Sphingomonas sp. AOB5 TaxID=3034017 RepID=UPI0023F82FDC|nr:hypothetical protein [Sphingomonas sp. AOB5]MDF7774334.1 hypothetical protein [Sphingomonas sp. AOB5]